MITIIGIDPGLAATGVGIVRGNGRKIDGYSFGSISTSKKYSLPNRLDLIFSKLLQILKDENPDLMVVEDVFSLKKYPKSGITLGQVAGVVMLAGCRAGVSSIEIPVREAKQVLTGNGNANKMQLEEAVRHRLNHHSPIKPYHASDAVGLALIGFYRYQHDRLSRG
jgi:crossover junction endodeoxyribonuclease RuvC